MAHPIILVLRELNKKKKVYRPKMYRLFNVQFLILVVKKKWHFGP